MALAVFCGLAACLGAAALTARFRSCAIGVVCLLASPSARARADIVFCNNFPHLVYVAIAYPQQDGSWISRGWLNVDTGQCTEFDSAVKVKAFYYRGESVPYRDGGRQVKTTWGGNDAQFAIWEDSNFNYWDAQTQVLDSSLAGFIKGAETTGDAISATVSFDADGIHSTVTTHANAKSKP
jgi:uncharacterized membrane protein